TGKIPFIQSCAASPVVFMTLVIAVIGLIIPYSPIGAALKMTPLPIMYYPYLMAILLSYGILTQVVKRYFIRKYGQWL
ncbi:MAG: ATPase, partial [Prevotella sp.]|nr:ATPase [Prevotella sp.]